MSGSSQRIYNDDRPLNHEKPDRLGFKEPAQHVAKSITDFASPEGFVLGLEGEWGTGKSSLVHLISSSLKSSDNPPEIVNFAPWLVSSTDALLTELFSGLASAALEIAKSAVGGGEDGGTDSKTQKLQKAFKGFRSHLTKAGSVAKLASVLSVPGAGLAAALMDAAAGVSETFDEGPSLEEQKEELKTQLRALERKIVVFVDDLDRLEPEEAGEVVRLVRAVADFPNVVYVLCYSKTVLALSLNSALSITNGEDYIEKIVQVEFSVPEPEPFDLRRMFREELEKIFPAAFFEGDEQLNADRRRRLLRVIDTEGGRALLSPRDVARAVNAMILYAGPISDKIDLADMVWLQLIRLRNRNLYKWIEGYVNGCAAIAVGGSVTSSSRKSDQRRLVELLKNDQRDVDEAFWMFESMLPGFESSLDPNDDQWSLYSNIDDDDYTELVRDRRLGSPEHYRYYFALSKPSGAIDDVDFDRFLDDLKQKPEAALTEARRLFLTKRKQGGVLGEAMLSRLSSAIDGISDDESLTNVIYVLANCMDDAARQTGKGDWGRYWVWVTADTVFERCIAKITKDKRLPAVERAFGEGSAMGWLTNLLRDFLFEHGRTGDRKKPEKARTLTSQELDRVIELMISRYRPLTMGELLTIPEFVHIFYAWMQSGDDHQLAVQAWIKANTRDDTMFLKFLANMRSWAAVNDQVYYPFKWSRIEPLLDVEEAKVRFEKLRKETDPEKMKLIQIIDDALKAARDTE